MTEFIFTTPIEGVSQNRAQVPSSASTPVASVRPYRKACIVCRDRKVKCDKQSPCSNCQKLLLDCVYPSPFRPTSRPPKEKVAEKSSKETEQELLERIKKLEGAVQDLSGLRNEVLRSRKRRKDTNLEDGDTERDQSYADEEHGHSKAGIVSGIDREVGRLIVEDGKSRYINGGFWTSLEQDDNDLHVILDLPVSERATAVDRPLNSERVHHGFPFSPANANLYSLHPSPMQIQLLWDFFTGRVDPLAKVLHKPTIQRIVTRISESPETLEGLDKGTEAMFFMIYFAAATSMTDEELEDNLDGNRDKITSKYRHAAENALMNANFLNTQEFVTLQAFILYLSCVRWSEDTRMVWTLTGLAIRIAQSLGLHRDGKHFPELSSFDKEMRRRVWWQLHYLDCCASEDHGSDSASAATSFDTSLPLNIDDSALDIDIAIATLKDRDGISDMTFCLIRYELTQTRRLIKATRPLADKENLLKGCYQLLESKYLAYSQQGGTLYWLAENIARMAIAREWLVLSHDQLRLDRGSTSREMKDRLFLTNLQIIETSIQLESDPRAKEWRWLIPRSHQWLPISFVLAELCVRSKCDVVDRAWRAVEANYSQRSVSDKWKSGNDAMLQKLMKKARAKRDEELTTERWNLLTNVNVGSTPRISESDESIQTTPRTGELGVTEPVSSSNAFSASSTYDILADQPSTLAPWNLNDSAFVNNMGVPDEAMYWSNWDQLVTDFQGGFDGHGQYAWGAP